MDWLIVSFLDILHNPDTYGHLFYATILIGTFLISRKRKTGWLYRVVGDVGWVAIGYLIGMYSIVAWSAVFALNDLRGYFLWKWKEDRKKLKKQRKQNENSKLQGERERIAEAHSPENKGSVQPARLGRSESPNGEPWTRHNVKRDFREQAASINRMQEYEELSQPKRTGTSEV